LKKKIKQGCGGLGIQYFLESFRVKDSKAVKGRPEK